jgi:hypothetical protein
MNDNHKIKKKMGGKMKRKLWNNIVEELKDNIFNKEILKNFINKFYDKIVRSISEDQHILFIFLIELINKDILTLSKLLKISNESKDKNSLISYLLDSINLTNDNYNNAPINALIISYGLIKGKITPRISSFEETNQYHIYYNHKLPIALKAEDYGNVITKIGLINIIQLKRNISLIILSKDNKNHIKYYSKES